MMRLRNRNKSRDHSRVGQEQLEQLTDFSLFKDLSGQVSILMYFSFSTLEP